MKKKINIFNKKTIWLSLTIVLILGLFGSLFILKQKIENIEKDISQLNSVQKNEKERIDNLITFNWQRYFNRDWITFKYPEFASLCEDKTDEDLDIKVSFSSDCKELEKNATMRSLWDFEIKYIRKDFNSTEDLLDYVGLQGAENITTEETRNKFPRIGGDHITEWYLTKKNDTYAIIDFNPEASKKLKSPNLALVIMARNYGGLSLKNEPIIDLILKSIQLP